MISDPQKFTPALRVSTATLTKRGPECIGKILERELRNDWAQIKSVDRDGGELQERRGPDKR